MKTDWFLAFDFSKLFFVPPLNQKISRKPLSSFLMEGRKIACAAGRIETSGWIGPRTGNGLPRFPA
jgi:hypothetical protein